MDAMIESMRKQRPMFTLVDRPARDTDRVTIDYHMHADDGSEHAHKHDHDVDFIVGAGRVVPQLNDAVKGMTCGRGPWHRNAAAGRSGGAAAEPAAPPRCTSP